MVQIFESLITMIEKYDLDVSCCVPTGPVKESVVL